MGVSPRVTKSGSLGTQTLGGVWAQNWEPGRQIPPDPMLTIGSSCIPLSRGSGRPRDTLTSHRPSPRVSYPARFRAQHKKGDLLCGHERSLTATQKSPGRNIPFGGTPSLLLSRPKTKYPVQGDPLTPFVASGNEISRSGRPPTPFIAPKDEISRAGKGGSTVCYCQGHVDRKDQ